MKLEVNLSVFASGFYPEGPSNKIVLEGKAFAIRERDGSLDAVVVISDGDMCKLPFYLIAPKTVRIKAMTWGIAWRYLILQYKKTSIVFWECKFPWGIIRDMIFTESSVFIEDGQFLKGTPVILEKYMIRVVKEERK